MADLGHPAAHAVVEILPEQVALGQRSAGFVSASRTKSGKYSSVGGGSIRIGGGSGSCGHLAGTTLAGGVAHPAASISKSSAQSFFMFPSLLFDLGGQLAGFRFLLAHPRGLGHGGSRNFGHLLAVLRP
ncbi:MAG TPA: hypothetical protein PLN91_09705, partial [Rhodanobacteraceae bacterium]|nr:hypothetical protein [Rhodanobacteraceae bacterium]